MDKLKVIWICQFTNKEIQTKLPLWKHINEFAPWIPNKIKGIQDKDDVELHVIAPHQYLKKQVYIKEGNIHYYFIPFGIPIIHRRWPWILPVDLLTNFYFVKKRIRKVVKNIQPDLINIYGTEGTLSSSSAFTFKNKYPVLISIQGFISEAQEKPSKKKLSNLNLKKRIEVEERILESFNFFSGDPDSKNYIGKYNDNFTFYEFVAPINESLMLKETNLDKKYDCVYFGRITKNKGIEDLVKITRLIKKKKSSFKLLIIGGGEILTYQKMACDNGCEDNIEFSGFLENQSDVYQKVAQSRLFLMTTYFDRLSLAIREAMFLKVPVISYATGSIPTINNDRENIVLIERGNYKLMAEKTLNLLKNPKEQENLYNKAFEYANDNFGIEASTNKMLDAYYDILKRVNL
ncbi:MAG: glycosyltransferase family 4 protein [bacterium]